MGQRDLDMYNEEKRTDIEHTPNAKQGFQKSIKSTSQKEKRKYSWAIEGKGSADKARTIHESEKRKKQTNQEFLMEQIQLLNEEEKKRKALS